MAPRPVGKPRSPWLVILLTVVTFGIWTIIWSYQNGEELKRHTGTGLGGVAYLLITLFISPVTMFLMDRARRIGARRAVGLTGGGH